MWMQGQHYTHSLRNLGDDAQQQGFELDPQAGCQVYEGWVSPFLLTLQPTCLSTDLQHGARGCPGLGAARLGATELNTS